MNSVLRTRTSGTICIISNLKVTSYEILMRIGITFSRFYSSKSYSKENCKIIPPRTNPNFNFEFFHANSSAKPNIIKTFPSYYCLRISSHIPKKFDLLIFFSLRYLHGVGNVVLRIEGRVVFINYRIIKLA